MNIFFNHSKSHFLRFITLFLYLIYIPCFAKSMAVVGQQLVAKPMVYKNVTLDLSKGGFRVTNIGNLDIENSILNITISPDNPYFILLDSGTLTLKNNIVNVTVTDIAPDQTNQSLYYLLQIVKGFANISGNSFYVNKFFTVGLFITDQSNLTSNINITNNMISNFHGGIYLINSNGDTIANNAFINVSFSNIFNVGVGNVIKGNTFRFPGNLSLGDAIDIINSDNTVCAQNIVESGSSYGITVVASKNVTVDANRVVDCLSYGIFVATPTTPILAKDGYFSKLFQKYHILDLPNTNIIVTNNYISQNRFGLGAGPVTGLTVEFNTFIQRFSDAATRKFWTDNTNLLFDVTGLIWQNNLYKEAFTQDVPGDNTLALQFVPFPVTGGVTF